MANEEATLEEFVRQVLVHSAASRRVTFFAVVDLVSEDRTQSLLEGIAASEARVRVVWAPENRCLVDAYVRGYRAALEAGCDWILEIDAGFSHQPEQIPRFLEQIPKGFDCIFGSRFCPGGRMEGGSLKRYFISRGGTVVSNLVLGTRLHDMTSGFQLFSREVLELLLRRGIRSRAHFFQTEMKAYCHDFHVVEVPITYRAPSPRLRRSALTDALRQLWALFVLRLKGRLRIPQQATP